MSQTKEKRDSLVLSRGDFWTIWRCHGLPCFHIYFLFNNNGKREQLDGNDSCCCYGIFFSKLSFRKYLITAMFKVLSEQLQSTLATAFERHLQPWEIYTDTWISTFFDFNFIWIFLFVCIKLLNCHCPIRVFMQ